MASLVEENRPGLEEDNHPVQQYGQKDESSTGDTQSRANDVDLLRRIGRGEEAAFRALVDRHARYLTGIALTLAGNNAADAEDLVQETFTATLTSPYRGEAAARTWLVNILVRRAAMLRRSRRREHGTPMKAPEPGSASSVAESDARLDVARMLEHLPPDQRQVIVLRELQGLSYDAMADVLKVPRGTVESRLHRARAALKELVRGFS